MVKKEEINYRKTVFPATGKNETQASWKVSIFSRVRILHYSLIASPLYQLTQKKNDFK